MLGLRYFVQEELAEVKKMLRSNQSTWEEFDGIRKSKPDAAILKYPLTLHARPYVGDAVTCEKRVELDIQDRLWKYLKELDVADTRYGWSEAVSNRFTLLSARRNHQHVREQGLFEGFAEHDELLKWLATRRILQDVQRRLRCLDALKKHPCP